MRVSHRRGAGLVLGLVLLSTAAMSQGIQLPRIGIPGSGPSIQVRTLEVRDVALGTAPTSTVSIARIAFSGFVRDGDTVRAERVEFENLVGQLGTRKVEIPAISISGFHVPVELFRALTEGGSNTLDWVPLLQKATIDEVSIPTVKDHDSAAELQTSYQALTLKGFRNGILQSAELQRMVGRGPESGDDKLSFTLGSLRYQGVDVAELLRFGSGGGSGPAKPLLESMVVSDFNMTVGDTMIGVAKFEVSGVDGRAPDTALPPFSDTSRIMIPGQPDAATQRGMAAHARGILRHLRIGRYSVEGLRLASTDSGGFNIGAITISGFSGRGIDQIEFKDFDLAMPGEIAIKLDRFAVERISYGALLDILLDAAVAGAEPDFSPGKLSKAAPRLGAIRLARLEANTPKGPVSLGDLRFEIDGPEAAVPEKTTFAFNGLKLKLASYESNPGRDKLVALGYDELLANAQLQLRWAPNERALILDNTGVLIDRLGRMDLSVRVGEIALDPVPVDPEAAERVFKEARLESAAVRLTNLGFAERFFAQVARTAGLSQDAVRAGFAAELRTQATAMFGPALAPGSAEAVEAFIRSPSRLVARAVPRPGQPPLKIRDFERLSPPQIMGRVSVKIEIPTD